jgi:cytochrome o ubiquinol oxidase subunit 2
MASNTSRVLPVLQSAIQSAAGVIGVLAVLCTALSGCERGVLDPAGPVGGAERVIMLDALTIMLAIVVPTILCTLAFAWWYRATNRRALYAPHWAYSGRLELLVWSIPALVVMFLGGIAWISSHDLDPANPSSARGSAGSEALEVQVVALDWKWLFIYPEQHVASINRLVAPIGTPVHFRLTSASVMNVFFVPQLGSEIYAMNGMVTELYLQADRAGNFLGLAAHINGDGFSDMTFDTHAVSTLEFSEWVGATQTEGPALDEAAYRSLLRQSANIQPYTYRQVTPNLFEAIASRRLPAGEGPRITQAGADIAALEEE